MNEFVTLEYGSGGRKTSQMISEMILPLLGVNKDSGTAAEGGNVLGELGDGAVLAVPQDKGQMVFSTDSFVVSPYFFPGGDIGKLSVCGTVNDVSMMGAEAKYLSLSFIIEEGMPFEDLKRIIESIGRTAAEAGVSIVTGDTKVVDKGRGDGIYINTAGIGFVKSGVKLSPANIRPGDAIIISGNIGDHGTAVMLARNPELMKADIVSDCAALKQEAMALTEALGSDLRCMRDPTRGGLATTLNEFIEDRSDIGIELAEKDIPVSAPVRSACDMLGLDPLYCACEGRLIAVVAPDKAEKAAEILHGLPNGSGAKLIGHVCSEHPKKLVIRTELGTGRIAAKLSGAQLPRIC